MWTLKAESREGRDVVIKGLHSLWSATEANKRQNLDKTLYVLSIALEGVVLFLDGVLYFRREIASESIQDPVWVV